MIEKSKDADRDAPAASEPVRPPISEGASRSTAPGPIIQEPSYEDKYQMC